MYTRAQSAIEDARVIKLYMQKFLPFFHFLRLRVSIPWRVESSGKNQLSRYFGIYFFMCGIYGTSYLGLLRQAINGAFKFCMLL